VAVKIKLKRLGKIREPYYRIIIADARTKRDGRVIEEIGKYHPKAEPSFIEVNTDRAQHWLSVGAQPTGPVRKILEITGDWQKFKGLPGAEGTLRIAAAREDRKELFAAALKETLDGGDAAPKGKPRARAAEHKPDAKSGQAQPGQPKAGRADKPARQPTAATAAAGEAAPDASLAGAAAADALAAEAAPAATAAGAAAAPAAETAAGSAPGAAASGATDTTAENGR